MVRGLALPPMCGSKPTVDYASGPMEDYKQMVDKEAFDHDLFGPSIHDDGVQTNEAEIMKKRKEEKGARRQRALDMEKDRKLKLLDPYAGLPEAGDDQEGEKDADGEDTEKEEETWKDLFGEDDVAAHTFDSDDVDNSEKGRDDVSEEADTTNTTPPTSTTPDTPNEQVFEPSCLYDLSKTLSFSDTANVNDYHGVKAAQYLRKNGLDFTNARMVHYTQETGANDFAISKTTAADSDCMFKTCKESMMDDEKLVEKEYHGSDIAVYFESSRLNFSEASIRVSTYDHGQYDVVISVAPPDMDTAAVVTSQPTRPVSKKRSRVDDTEEYGDAVAAVKKPEKKRQRVAAAATTKKSGAEPVLLKATDAKPDASADLTVSMKRKRVDGFENDVAAAAVMQRQEKKRQKLAAAASNKASAAKPAVTKATKAMNTPPPATTVSKKRSHDDESDGNANATTAIAKPGGKRQKLSPNPSSSTPSRTKKLVKKSALAEPTSDDADSVPVEKLKKVSKKESAEQKRIIAELEAQLAEKQRQLEALGISLNSDSVEDASGSDSEASSQNEPEESEPSDSEKAEKQMRAAEFGFRPRKKATRAKRGYAAGATHLVTNEESDGEEPVASKRKSSKAQSSKRKKAAVASKKRAREAADEVDEDEDEAYQPSKKRATKRTRN